MLNYLVLDSWFMISIYFNVPRFQGFSSPPWKINLNVWNDLDKSHPMTILSDPPSVGDFQTCFSLPSSLSLSLSRSPSAGRERGWVISKPSPARSFVWWWRQKLRRGRLFECLRGTGLFQLTKCFMAVKYDDTTRPGRGAPLKNAQNFICTNYKPWTPASPACQRKW